MQDAKMVTVTWLLKADTAGYMFCFCFLLYLFLTIPSVLLFFNALTLLVGRQEEHLACKN